MESDVQGNFVIYEPQNKETVEDMISLVSGGVINIRNLQSVKAFSLLTVPAGTPSDETSLLIRSFALKNETYFPEKKEVFFIYTHGDNAYLAMFCFFQKEKEGEGKKEIVMIANNFPLVSDAGKFRDPAKARFLVPKFV